MLISLRGGLPLQRQLYEALKLRILERRAAPGSRLPSSRVLAEELEVARNTVLLVYEQLSAEGYVETRHGSGTFVAALDEAGPSHRDGRTEALVASLSGEPQRSALGWRIEGLTEDTLPKRQAFAFNFRYSMISADDFPAGIWRRLLLRELRRRSSLPYVYEDPQGLPALRVAICDYLLRARAVRAAPEQVLIVNGTQQALDLTVRLMVDPGTPVVVEDPGYAGARVAFGAAGARVLAVPVDDEGLDVRALPPPELGVRLAHVTPSHQFPVGATMPLGRRLALLEWAERGGTYLFEDDYDSEYRYGGRAVEAIRALDRSGRVIYAGSASKVLSPGLRLGYVVLPEELLEPFLRLKQVTDWHTAPLEQAVFADLIRDGHFERHIRRTRRRNRQRRDALVRALRTAFGDAVEIRGAEAGLHLTVWFRALSGRLAGAFAEAAAKADVGIEPIASARDRHAGFVMRYGGLDERTIERGVARLSEVLRSFPIGVAP